MQISELHLYNFGKMTVGGKLEPLFFGPRLHTCQPLVETRAPVARAQLQFRLQDHVVEQPHVDVVEQLRKELDCQRSVDTATSQQRHRHVQNLHHVSYKVLHMRTLRHTKVIVAIVHKTVGVDAHLPVFDSTGGINQKVSDAWPVRRQTYRYFPSIKASSPLH